MCERQTFSIDFIVRKCKADKRRADIFARVTVDGEIAEISTKNQIDYNNWDNKKEIVKGKSIEIATINEHIRDVRYRLTEKHRELERQAELITAMSVKQAYLGVQKKIKGRKLLELTEYYEKIWKDKIEFKNYDTTIDYIKRFVKSHFEVEDIYLSQVDLQFATDLEHYIRNNPLKAHDPCKGNGLGKHLQRFKRILNWATEEIKWIAINPCAKYKCAIKKAKRKKLKIEELIAIERHVFVNPKLAYVRDLFIFSCYTGLAFADVMALCPADFERLKNGVILCTIYRTKSDELCAIPFLKRAIEIMLKYNDFKTPNHDKIFPHITNQEVNRCLKIIADMCEVYTPLTFHVARHTFAKVIALKNGIPLETVQIMLGHTKITTTQIYADVDEEKVLNDMEGMDEKIEKRKELAMARA
ncbi:MAG: site-specific integrase [Sphingobacteriales bacterium]|nr:site-specific integrase [Sphingobacteriales bacterium]